MKARNAYLKAQVYLQQHGGHIKVEDRAEGLGLKPILKETSQVGKCVKNLAVSLTCELFTTQGGLFP